MRESLTEKGGQQLLRPGGKNNAFRGSGECVCKVLQVPCLLCVWPISVSMQTRQRQQRQWEQRGQRRATVHQLDLWFPVFFPSACLFFLLYFKSGLSWNYAHGGMRWQGVSWGSACMSDSWVGYAKAIKKASDLTLSRRRLRSAERGGSWPCRGNKSECSGWNLS